MGRLVRISAAGFQTVPAHRAVYIAPHLRADLSEHALGHQDSYRLNGRSVLARGRILAALYLRL